MSLCHEYHFVSESFDINFFGMERYFGQQTSWRGKSILHLHAYERNNEQSAKSRSQMMQVNEIAWDDSDAAILFIKISDLEGEPKTKICFGTVWVTDWLTDWLNATLKKKEKQI